MSERIKMVLKLLALIGITALIGLLLFTLFFGGSPNVPGPSNEPEETISGGGLPSAGDAVPGLGGTPTPNDTNGDGRLDASPVADGGLTESRLLTTSAIKEPIVTTSGTVTYYDPRDGRFYTIDENGNVKLLSQATFPEAQAITFSHDATSAVMEFPDGSNVIYNFQSGSQVTLPSHWVDFSFSDDGREVASKSIGSDPSNRTLTITTADGSNTRVIAALGANDDQVDVSWSPDGNIVGFSETGLGGNAFGQNEVYLIGEDGEAAGVLVVNGSNFQNIWSPNGVNLLYSVADAGDDYRASLWYADSRGDRGGGVRLRLSIKTTASKCTFASATLAYCAVPLEMPAGGGATPSLIRATDALYSIDLPSGRTTLEAQPATPTKMTNLSVSPDGADLFYTDSAGRLNLMRLK